jgi:uncharacterized membrane protein (UPF0127 family)
MAGLRNGSTLWENTRVLRRVLLFAIPAFLLSAGSAATDTAPGVMETLVIETLADSVTLTVEIASDPESRERGLMFRHNLPEGRGMLFEYETPQRISMWMKNTFIPLDMIFIRSNGTVAEVAAHTTPRSLDIIQSEEPVVAVLEVAAGTSERLGITRGSIIRHRFFGNSQ